MLLVSLLALSGPLAAGCAWFAYKAWRVGKRDAARNMAVLAAGLFVTSAGIAGWLWLALSG